MERFNCLVHGEPSDHTICLDANVAWQVADLRREICVIAKRGWAERQTNLWQVSIPDDENIDNTLKNLKLEESDDVKKMKPTWSIIDYYQNPPQPEHIHIIVEPPEKAGQPPTVEAAVHSPLVGLGGTAVAAQKRLAEDDLYANINDSKRFVLKLESTKDISTEDLERNEITVINLLGNERCFGGEGLPGAVKVFYDSLIKKVPLKASWLSNDADGDADINALKDVIRMLQLLLGDEFKLHFEVEDSKVEEGKIEDLFDQLVVYLNVARHYRKTVTGFTSAYSALAKEVNLSAWIVDPAIRDLGRHYQRNMNSCNAAVVDIEGRTTKWTPRNDFQVVYGNNDTTKYSLLMGEADSTHETEGKAMRKMAVLSKRSWEIRATLFGQHDHAVLCAFVSEFHCTMYLFYKKENSYIMHQILSFTNTFRTSTEAVGYLRRLYNFAEQARGHKDLVISGKLKKTLEHLLERAEMPEKNGSQKTIENATEGQSRSSAPQNPSVVQLAARYGGVTPLTNYPSIFTVKSITKNKIQVAKWTTRAREVELLMSLQSMDHPRYRKRVVEVTEIIRVTDGAFIVMPQRCPLTLVRNLSKSSYLDLRFQLVEGVAFLHAQNVAHCDLKPDNILVVSAWKPYGGLVISDFGNACSVASGYLCRGYQGTRGWTAPEVSNNMEWDPLSADVWATAKTSLYLAKDAAYEDQVMIRIIGYSTPSSRPIISSLYDAILSEQTRTSKRTLPEESVWSMPSTKIMKRGNDGS